MKLRICANDFGPAFHCYDEDNYDDAIDAGPQLIGQGDTEGEAIGDYFDQLLYRLERLS